MDGSRKIFWNFGWVTNFFLKFWVGLEIHLEILGGSWNSTWNFGWVMKIFQSFENVSRPLWTKIHVRSLSPLRANFGRNKLTGYWSAKCKTPSGWQTSKCMQDNAMLRLSFVNLMNRARLGNRNIDPRQRYIRQCSIFQVDIKSGKSRFRADIVLLLPDSVRCPAFISWPFLGIMKVKIMEILGVAVKKVSIFLAKKQGNGVGWCPESTNRIFRRMCHKFSPPPPTAKIGKNRQ